MNTVSNIDTRNPIIFHQRVVISNFSAYEPIARLTKIGNWLFNKTQFLSRVKLNIDKAAVIIKEVWKQY